MNNMKNSAAGGMGNPAHSCIGQAMQHSNAGAVGQGSQVPPNIGNAWFAANPSAIMGQVGMPVGNVGGAPVYIHSANNGAPPQVVGMGWGAAGLSQPRETIVLPSTVGLCMTQPGGQPLIRDPRAGMNAAALGMGLGGGSTPNLGEQQATAINAAVAAALAQTPQPAVYDAALEMAMRRVEAQLGGNTGQTPQYGNFAASGMQGSGTGGNPRHMDHGSANGTGVAPGCGPGDASRRGVPTGQGVEPKPRAPGRAAGGEGVASRQGRGSAGGSLGVSHPPLKKAKKGARRPQASDGRPPRKQRGKRQDGQQAKTCPSVGETVGKPAFEQVAGDTRVVPAEGHKPGKGAEVGEALAVGGENSRGLPGGVPAAQAGSHKEQGSAPHPDVSTQGDSFPPSIPSNPVGPSTTPSEAQPGKDEEGKGETENGGGAAGNASGRRGKKRKPRTYTDAVPSRHCHICSRRPDEPKFPHFVCGNLLRSRCRKTICQKCFDTFNWDPEEVRKAEPGSWLCTHCRDECPERAQCMIYNRTSIRRKKKMIKHRKKKTDNGPNPNGSAATKRKSTRRAGAKSKSRANADPVATAANNTGQNAQHEVGPNQGTTAAGLNVLPPLESLPQNGQGQPTPGQHQNSKRKKGATKRRRNENQTSKPSKKARNEERVVLARTKEEFVAQMQKHGGDIQEMIRHSGAIQQASAPQNPPVLPQGSDTLQDTRLTSDHVEQPVAPTPPVSQQPVPLPIGNTTIHHQTAHNTQQCVMHPPAAPQEIVTVPTENPNDQLYLHNKQETMADIPSMHPRNVDMPKGDSVINPNPGNTQQNVGHPPSVLQGHANNLTGNPVKDRLEGNTQHNAAHHASFLQQFLARQFGIEVIDPRDRRMTHHPFVPKQHTALPSGNPVMEPAADNVPQGVAHSSAVSGGQVYLPVENQTTYPTGTDMQQTMAHITSDPQGNTTLPYENQAIYLAQSDTHQNVAHTPQIPIEAAHRQTNLHQVMPNDRNLAPRTQASVSPNDAEGNAVGNTCATQDNDVCLQIDEAIAAAGLDIDDALEKRQVGCQARERNCSHTPATAPMETQKISSTALESLTHDGRTNVPEKQFNPSVIFAERVIDEDGDNKASQLNAAAIELDGAPVTQVTQERSAVEALVDSFLADDPQQVPPLLGTAEGAQAPGNDQMGAMDGDGYGDLRVAVNDALVVPEEPVQGLGNVFADRNRERGDFLGSNGDPMNLPGLDFDVGSPLLFRTVD